MPAESAEGSLAHGITVRVPSGEALRAEETTWEVVMQPDANAPTTLSPRRFHPNGRHSHRWHFRRNEPGVSSLCP
ncbi:hypothetical protein GCM10010275_05010 [Streptomyces litmocidini]|nr:hypothetical protein GCM10010275_05010 [Streptomyces litmocidini]